MGVVVDRCEVGTVLLLPAEQLLVEFAHHIAPQIKVVRLIPRRLVGGLEDADRHHLIKPAGVRDPGRITPMQQESRTGLSRSDSEGGDGQSSGTASGIGRITDRLPQRPDPARTVFMADRLTDIDHVEIVAAREGQCRLGRAEVAGE